LGCVDDVFEGCVDDIFDDDDEENRLNIVVGF
jgi:hypothetical protein